MKQVKRVISLIVSLILLATSVVFATEENQVCQNSRKSLGESENLIIMPGNVEINGAPAGVKFCKETTGQGSYEIEGISASTSASAIAVAMGVGGINGYILLGVTTALSTGASHIYWVKKIAYGEDSEYYYVRTKIRLYSDAAHTNSVTEWKTVYHKKSKSSGAAVEGEQI